MRVTRYKNTHCHTCKKDFHYLGINRHRAMQQGIVEFRNYAFNK